MTRASTVRRVAVLVTLTLLGGAILVWGTKTTSLSPSSRPPDEPSNAPTAPRFSRFPAQAATASAVPAPQAPSSWSLHGRVMTTSGAPIVGAKVTISRFDELSAELTTDGEGRFDAVLEPGPIDLEASAPGYVTDTRTFEAPGPDAADGELELRLARGGVLVGKVVRDDSGEAVVGCEVHVGVEDDDSPNHPTTTTDPAGLFRLEGLGSGPYAVVARCDGLHGQGARVVLAPGETSPRLVVRVRKAARVRGRLVIAPGNTPCARGDVRLDSVISGDLYADTDAEGRVSFPAVPRGTYKVYVSCVERVLEERLANLVVGDADRDEVFVVTERASIRGVVVDTSGEPLRGVMVYASPAKDEVDGGRGGAGNGVERSGSNDFSSEDGSFALLDLSPGGYDVELEKYRAPGPLRVVVPAVGSPAPLRIVLDRKTLVGRVVDPQGRGVSAAQVEIGPDGADKNVFVEVDAHGRFRADFVGDASTRVRIEVGGRELPILGDGSVGPVSDSERAFTVQAPTGELRGQIKSSRGEPVANASVGLDCPDASGQREASDDQGWVRFRHLSTGTSCDVNVTAQNGESGEASAVAVGGTFEISLRRAATLRGVVKAGGKAFVVSVLGGPRSALQRFDGGGGAWEFPNVPAGDLTVQVEADGLSGTAPVSVRPGETKVVDVPLEPDDDLRQGAALLGAGALAGAAAPAGTDGSASFASAQHRNPTS